MRNEWLRVFLNVYNVISLLRNDSRRHLMYATFLENDSFQHLMYAISYFKVAKNTSQLSRFFLSATISTFKV